MIELAGLISEHVSAFEYDWRTRFGTPLTAVFRPTSEGGMTWREAWSLTEQLLTDPSSRVFAAVAGWDYPWPRETFVLADLIDVTRRANMRKGSKFVPYPRPTSKSRVRSKRPLISQAVLKRLLKERGPQRPA